MSRDAKTVGSENDEDKIATFLHERGAVACSAPEHRHYGYTAKGRNDALDARPDGGQPPEVRLAQAKLAEMLKDLAGKSLGVGSGGQPAMRIQAERWFFGHGDFDWWCEVAGFEPEYVRRQARQILESGLPDDLGRRNRICTGRTGRRRRRKRSPSAAPRAA